MCALTRIAQESERLSLSRLCCCCWFIPTMCVMMGIRLHRSARFALTYTKRAKGSNWIYGVSQYTYIYAMNAGDACDLCIDAILNEHQMGESYIFFVAGSSRCIQLLQSHFLCFSQLTHHLHVFMLPPVAIHISIAHTRLTTVKFRRLIYVCAYMWWCRCALLSQQALSMFSFTAYIEMEITFD